MTPTLSALREKLIEQHARRAVLEHQHQSDSYQPTPWEANALKNFRHILGQFADALLSGVVCREEAPPIQEDEDARVDDGSPRRIAPTGSTAIGNELPVSDSQKRS